ncbi:MAG TPA: LysR family transcriptional regulator [Dongiaceae bacterium]|nr:LysR family transcriptional regulator [Dongiaceae bacterium]
MNGRQQAGESLNWDDLRLFLPVARSGRLTEAATLLQLSISTVARRLAQLEQDLGLSLFLRSQSGYALTEDGRRLLRKAEAVETAMFGVNRLADAVATKGHVRVALPEGFALQIILPRLSAFRAAHPAIALDLVTGPFSLDLMRRESDIALRLVKPTDNDLLLRKLGRMAHGIYAARHLAPKQAERLPKLAWPAEMRRLPIAEATAAWIADTGNPADSDLALNSLNALAAAAANGLGRALLPCVVGDAAPGLRRIAGPAGLFTQEIFLVLHRDLRLSPRMRAVADFLADSILAAADQLAGREAATTKGAAPRATGKARAAARRKSAGG